MINIQFPETKYIGCKSPQVSGRNGDFIINSSSKEYIFELLDGMEKPKIGDMCVVSCSNGFQVAMVTSINCFIPDSWDKGTVSHVVGFVDYETYKGLVERKKQKKALKDLLVKKKKEMDEQFAWDLYAEKSPEFAELLKKYNSL